MSQNQTLEMDVNGLKLAYQIAGSLDSDKPVILFGHSYLWDSFMWREQVEQLQQQFTCIMTDLPAHGNSGLNPDKTYDIQYLAELHAQFMQALNIKKYAVVGLSVGGMWGTQLALSHPENVTALAIMDSFVGAEPKESQQEYFNLLDTIEQNGITSELADTLVTYFLTPDSIKNNPELVNRFKQPLQAYNQSVERRKHLCEIGRYIFKRESLLEQLHQLTMPVHIIVGKQDLPRPPEESQLMAEHCTQCELSIIDNAVHICNLEQPEQVTKVLADFLKR